MADAAEDLELEPLVEDLEQEEAEPPEPQEGAEPEGEDDELQVSFGDGDAPPQSEERDSSVIRELRARNREQARELEALRRQQPQPQKIEVGEKPTIENCEYDTDRFEREYEAWTQRKAEADRQQAEAQKSQAAQQEDWNRRLQALEAQKAKLNAKDYDQCAEEVKSLFDLQQQALIVRATDNPALMIVALGRNPAKAADLAKISDPVELIKALAKLEGKISVTTKRAPPPEQIVRGSAPLSSQADKHLERLEKEAERTGDRTKIVQYKRRLKAQGKS